MPGSNWCYDQEPLDLDSFADDARARFYGDLFQLIRQASFDSGRIFLARDTQSG